MFEEVFFIKKMFLPLLSLKEKWGTYHWGGLFQSLWLLSCLYLKKVYQVQKTKTIFLPYNLRFVVATRDHCFLWQYNYAYDLSIIDIIFFTKILCFNSSCFHNITDRWLQQNCKACKALYTDFHSIKHHISHSQFCLFVIKR